jgi:DNA adenine methylase
MAQVKSPLRYPGGKSKVLDKILPHIPVNIREYREPFLGGGSVHFGVKQLFDSQIKKYWINDLNFDLYCFWLFAKNEIDRLVEEVDKIKQQYDDGRELFSYYTSDDLDLTEFDRAVRFFILNRITFSGTVDSGGYSQQAFEKRFTNSSIERLKKISTLLSDVDITNQDYEFLLTEKGEDVFIFLDPPYLTATKSRLYGHNGSLHVGFNHEKFARDMYECKHKWLITYDDSPILRKLFDFANITELTIQYGMNNYKQTTAAKGKEIIVKNY